MYNKALHRRQNVSKKGQPCGNEFLELLYFYRSIKNVENLDLSWEKNKIDQNTGRNSECFETKNWLQ